LPSPSPIEIDRTRDSKQINVDYSEDK
jgi:hypothetical protein